MLISSLGRTIQHHPWSAALDVTILIVMMGGAFMLALEYDIIAFIQETTPRERHVSVEEAFGLSGLLGFGICAFIWRRLRERQRDNERWRQAEAELRSSRQLAMEDPLTELPNRREFVSTLEAAIATAKGDSLAVYLLDLNGFKNVNDHHGHATGDDVLRAIAQRFRAAARSDDLVARLGGDEFAVIARDVATHHEASEIGERFVTALKNGVNLGGRDYPVGVAVGVALFPQDGATGNEIMHRADAAMYIAKATRKSTLRFFEPEIRLVQH